MKIFRADYKYAIRSYEYCDIYDDKEQYRYKEHKYKKIHAEYVKSLKIGDTGTVIREYSAESKYDRYNSYDAKIVMIDIEKNIVIYETSNMKYDGYKIIDNINRKLKLEKLKNNESW